MLSVRISLSLSLCAGILPLDSPCSGLCDAIDIDEQYLGNSPVSSNTTHSRIFSNLFHLDPPSPPERQPQFKARSVTSCVCRSAHLNVSPVQSLFPHLKGQTAKARLYPERTVLPSAISSAQQVSQKLKIRPCWQFERSRKV